MNINKPTLFLLIIFLLLSSMNFISAEEISQKQNNVISTWVSQEISNPLLKIIGINEAVSIKELIITTCLILIAFLGIYGLVDFSELIAGIGVNFTISIILVLAGSYTGIPLKIAKQITTISDTIQFLKSKSFLITIVVIVIIFICLMLAKKFLPKVKDIEQKEKIAERKMKLEKLTKIKDYKTDLELKRYGVE